MIKKLTEINWHNLNITWSLLLLQFYEAEWILYRGYAACENFDHYFRVARLYVIMFCGNAQVLSGATVTVLCAGSIGFFFVNC